VERCRLGGEEWIMAEYIECKGCGNREKGATIYICEHGHVYCDACAQRSALLSSPYCPVCNEKGAQRRKLGVVGKE
jgi:hypothetical protein